MSVNSEPKPSNEVPPASTRSTGPVESAAIEIGRATDSRATKQATLGLVIILSGASLLYWVGLSPERFGAYHDDGIYVTTAKALATGQGYRIISLPYEPAQTKYPPLYPFLLSLIWRAYPEFPQNLVPMMLLSVVATVIFLAVTWQYLVKQGYATVSQAFIVVALSAINWRIMILATGTYSEMSYAALTLVGLYLAEKHEKERADLTGGFVLGVVLGLVFLTRSSGLALLIAIAFYYARRKSWRRGLLPVAVAGSFVVGWVGWCYLNRTTAGGVNVGYYTSYLRDFIDIVNELHVHDNSPRIFVLLSIVGRNALMLVVFSPPVVCLGIDYSWVQYFGFVFMFIAAGFMRQASKGLRLLHFYIIAYLALHVFWLPYVSYDRFVILLLPFLLLFLVAETERLASLVARELRSSNQLGRRFGATVIGLGLILSGGAALYNYGTDLYSSLGSVSMSRKTGTGSVDTEAIAWINSNTRPSDVLVCYRDPMYFLYTGRKAIRSFAMKAGVLWQDNQPLIFSIIKENHGQYLVVTVNDFENEYQSDRQRESFKALVEQSSRTFLPVFQSKDGRSTIYRIENVNEQTEKFGPGA